jgi:hypothetical protein
LGGLLNKPKILYMDAGNNKGFNQSLGARVPQIIDNILRSTRTPLWMLDPTLLSPNVSKKVSVAIQFNNEMDITSVMNPANWEISRAKSTEAGYYNNLSPTTDREVSIPRRPFSITYDPATKQASVTFTVTQNASIDLTLDAHGVPIDNGATIDPAHLVFKFSGKDSSGRSMDTSGDQIDGAASKAF